MSADKTKSRIAESGVRRIGMARALLFAKSEEVDGVMMSGQLSMSMRMQYSAFRSLYSRDLRRYADAELG